MKRHHKIDTQQCFTLYLFVTSESHKNITVSKHFYFVLSSLYQWCHEKATMGVKSSKHHLNQPLFFLNKHFTLIFHCCSLLVNSQPTGLCPAPKGLKFKAKEVSLLYNIKTDRSAKMKFAYIQQIKYLQIFYVFVPLASSIQFPFK